ncbi:MAG: YhbY family RNA-binding protein [Clostridia bacterium]|nr:YhbY family RNA-binding protein [Clostridia bacterium]
MTSKQRAYLRGVASKYDTVFQVGKGGVGEKMVSSVGDALEAHEIVKITTLDNSEYGPREAAEEMAAALGAEVVCVIGNKFVLYHESKRKPSVSLIVKTL